MKKFLLGTSVLFGAAMIAGAASAAEPLTVTVGGYLDFALGVVDEDGDNAFRSHDFRTNSEVHVRAEGTAANGLNYGAHIELETDQGTNSGFNGDENHIFLSGGWGRMEFGDKEGAATADNLFVTAPGDWGLGGVVADVATNDPDYLDFVVAPLGSGADIFRLASTFEPFNAQRSTKITYYTPRWNGFQAGASYATDGGSTGQVVSRLDTLAASPGEPLGLGSYDNIFELAANYSGEYNSVGYAFSGSYVFGSAIDITAGDQEDLRSWGLGMNLTYAGFTFGGSYVNSSDSGLIEANTEDDSADSWTLGLQYESGPFVVGVNYINADDEGDSTVAADDEYDAFSVGGTYSFAPGLSAYAEATFFDFDDEGVATDTDGTVFVLGTRVAF